MMCVLKRNQPDWLQIQLSSVCGLASLRSADDHEISVPVASLLATSSFMRSILSDLHPALQTPLIISCPCPAEILITAGEVLNKGLVRVKDDRLLHEVQRMLDLLGVEVVLSCVKIRQDLVPNDAAVDEQMIDHDETSVGGGNNEEVKFEILIKVEVEDVVDDMIAVKEIEGNEKNKCPSVIFYSDEHVSGHAEDKWYKHKARHLSSDKNCKRQMKRRTSLMKHCSQCNYSTGHRTHLLEHIRTHTGDKPFECRLCDYSAARRRALKYHMKIHRGRKPFKCPNCDYYAVSKKIFDFHMMRKHKLEKPRK